MLALVAFGFVLLLGLQWFLFESLVKPQIEALEYTRIQQELARVQQAFVTQESNLSSVVSDWAAWDDLASFASKPEPGRAQEFLGKNPDISLERLHVNGFLAADVLNQPLIVNGFDFELEQEWRPVDWALKLVGTLQPRFTENPKARISGYLLAPSNQLVLVAAYPILDSSAQGPSRGVLGMLRVVDPTFIRSIEASVQLQLKVDLLTAQAAAELRSIAERATQDTQGLLVSELEDGTLTGYFVLKDINGQSIALVQLVGGSNLLQHGLQAFQGFLILTLLAMLILLLIISLTQSRLLSRLLHVTERVDKISRSHDLSLRIGLPSGNDELIDLTESVNRFLDTRQEMALELMASEERFRQLTNTAPVFIWMTNLAGDFSWFNDEMLRFVGLERDLFQVFRVGELIAAEDAALYQKVVERARAARQGYQLELRMRRHDGEYRWILLRASPMFSPDEQMTGYAGIGVDIHERKQMEAKVEFLAHYDALTELPNRTQLTE